MRVGARLAGFPRGRDFIASVAVSQRHAAKHGRAAAGMGFYLERSANGMRAVIHDVEPHSRAMSAIDHSSTVISDGHVEHGIGWTQADGDPARMPVAGGVVDCLLRDPVEVIGDS